MYKDTYTHIHIYKHIHIYVYDMRVCVQDMVIACRDTCAHANKYIHTYIHTRVVPEHAHLHRVLKVC